ncbi:hypothetical protein ACJ73_04810 [Blastomyces percursus]|uniref:Uncharacterized protein n=1 Tax=Blastomyces percursus TaxID=1658174 RepID=A0A1J9Q6Z0_9EURO|nr:hypothetical protein ACJ73_04810 [Blastomyces percursus]
MFPLDQQEDTNSPKMDVHWKRDVSVSLLGGQIDQERKGRCDNVMRRPSFPIFTIRTSMN